MPDAHSIICLLFILVQVFTGVLANGLIVMVNAIDWIKQRKIASSLDLLLACLAISRFFLQSYIFCGQLASLLLVNLSAFSEILILTIFTNQLSLWLATWLSVFYCAKIATIPHPVFVWLRMRISRLVPWLIFGSLLYTAVTYSIYNKYVREVSTNVFSALFSQNATYIRQSDATMLSFFFLEITVPVSIFLIAILLSVFSLGRHTQKMRITTAGAREAGRRAHHSAMLSILSFVVLYFSHYLLVTLLFHQVFQVGNSLFYVFVFMIGTYPSVHSIILIVGSPKLKQNAKTFLFCCKRCA